MFRHHCHHHCHELEGFRFEDRFDCCERRRFDEIWRRHCCCEFRNEFGCHRHHHHHCHEF